MSYVFHAIWPITDETKPFTALCAQATPEVPLLAAQAHARLIGTGRFTVAESSRIPGSGRVTPWVLIYEAPALRVPTRNYHRTTNQSGDTAA